MVLHNTGYYHNVKKYVSCVQHTVMDSNGQQHIIGMAK